MHSTMLAYYMQYSLNDDFKLKMCLLHNEEQNVTSVRVQIISLPMLL